MAEKTNTPRLWTRNFTIITLGSAVTMLGHALAGFAVSLLVLDYTGSVLLYSLFMAAYCLPKVIMPLLAGPWMDNFSRAKVIYGTDFLSAGIYLGMFLLIREGWFSYVPFLLMVLLVGSIDSVYLVAYDSLYPNLITPGNYAKAYSVSSLLYPLAAIMTPVASWVYERSGAAPLFLANALFFFTAACFETRIRAPESYREGKNASGGLRYMLAELRRGVTYIRGEKGLSIITAFFFIIMLAGDGSMTLWLPYFKSVPALGASMYSYVLAFNVAGRLVGGLIQYKLRYPAARKFAIALTVYLSIAVLDGSVLFCPPPVMMAVSLLSGVLSVTSYNIRISTTQSYVPDAMRGRYNGCFQMLTTLGTLLGQLSAGLLGDHFPLRALVVGYMCLSAVGCLTVMVPGREHVKRIYNCDV